MSFALPWMRSWIAWGVAVPVRVAPSAIASWLGNEHPKPPRKMFAASRLNAAASSAWSCVSVPVSAVPFRARAQ